MVVGTWEHSALDSTAGVGIWPMNGFQNKILILILPKDLLSSLGGIMDSKHWILESTLPLLITSSPVFLIVVECYYPLVKKIHLLCLSPHWLKETDNIPETENLARNLPKPFRTT